MISLEACLSLFTDSLSTWLKAFESIAILVPPTLPLIFYIGVVMSASNLKEKSIYTSNSSCIPIAGRVTTFCFDKTGTLYARLRCFLVILRTKPELDVSKAIPIIEVEESNENNFGPAVPVTFLLLNLALHSPLNFSSSLSHISFFLLLTVR